MRICETPGCGKKHRAKGLCSACYLRKLRADNLEKTRQRDRKWCAANIEKVREQRRKWRAKNPFRICQDMAKAIGPERLEKLRAVKKQLSDLRKKGIGV